MGLGVILILISCNTYGLSDGINFDDNPRYIKASLNNGFIQIPLFNNNSPRAAEDIVINEFVADPGSDWDNSGVADTNDEWIELYNPNDFLVDLTGWNISDTSQSHSLTGLTISAKSYIVIFRKDSNIALNNGGDTIFLKNETDTEIDSYQYYSSRKDVSIGRRPDGSTTWTSFYEPTINASNGPVPKVVFNEVLYNPKGSDTYSEWVELYNNGSDVNVTDWIFTTQESDEFYFPPFSFPNDTYLILSTSYGDHDLNFSDRVGLVCMELDSAILTNTGDDLLLMDLDGNSIDYISYGRSESIDPYPLDISWDGTYYNSTSSNYEGINPNPNASINNDTSGNTITLIPNGKDTDSVTDWTATPARNITKGFNNSMIFDFSVELNTTYHEFQLDEQFIFDITLKNLGSKQDTYKISIINLTANWTAQLDKNQVTLSPLVSTQLHVTVTAPDDVLLGNELELQIFMESQAHPVINTTVELHGVIPAVDLELSEFEIDGSQTLKELNEGAIVYLKTTLKNNGILDGTTFNVNFYFDFIDPAHHLGSKSYDSILAGGYKYPAINWDTLDFKGNYTLIVIADANSQIRESNENNNRLEYNISIIDTTPSIIEQQLLITEIYYDTRTSYDVNEFIRIYNPTNSRIDISWWEITDDPASNFLQAVSIPDDVWLEPKQMMYITNDAEAFLLELGFAPDIAGYTGSMENVIKLDNPQDWPTLSNSGDRILIRNSYRHVIDMVCYGDFEATGYPEHWQGESAATVPEGKILKRQRDIGVSQEDPVFIDTNTATDWTSSRLYGIGQSDFYPKTFEFIGHVTPFVSPESSLSVITSQIESAENYIYLNLYELTHPVLAESLLGALFRGVRMQILLEGNPVGWNFSNIDDPEVNKDAEYTQKYLLTQLYQSGANIKFLSDIKNDHKNHKIFKRYDYNHAKYCIIDGEKCLIMSSNWNPAGVPSNNNYGNREWGVVIHEKNLTNYFKNVFEADWEPISELQNDTHYYDLNSKVYGAPPSFFNSNYTEPIGWYKPLNSALPSSDTIINGINGDFKIEPVLSPDTAGRTDAAVIGMIKNAKESVYIQQMECDIDWVLIRTSSKQMTFNWSDSQNYYLTWLDGNQYYNEYLIAAIDAARRGCMVKILLDSRYVELDAGPGIIDDDSEIDNFDTVQYINKLAALEGLSNTLEARLSYLGGLEKMHNKGVLVDGTKVLISSINWNFNSVANNREVGVIIENGDLANFYGQIFEYDWGRAKAINNPILPNASEKAVLITEFYADTYLPNDEDEYIAIYNPTNTRIDLSGWILTDQLTKYTGFEGILVFPVNTWLNPTHTIYLTRNASAFYIENNFLPDFEYIVDSHADVPQLEIFDSSISSSRGPRLANKGDELVLADEYLFSDLGFEQLHIIDMVVYGNSSFISDFNNISYPFNNTHWLGPSIYKIYQGEIIKRNRMEKPLEKAGDILEFLDTNSAVDWESNRIYHPGQSDFKFNTISYTGSITVFSSPDSSYEIISNELDNAKSTIYLSVYQFHNPHLMDRLINASERGVDVKVFLDGAPVGGITDAAQYVAQQLDASGCEVRFIRSITAKRIYRRYRFMHAKYAVIDNFTAIILSENWKNSGVPVDNTWGNRGWGVVLRNAELAQSYAEVFFSDWNPQRLDTCAFNASDEKYGDPPDDFMMSWAVADGDYRPRFESRTINGEFKVSPVLAPDNTLDEYGSILEMINSATKSVYIEQLNCYIDWDTKNRDIQNLYLSAAIDAARRGCEVRILLDSAFVWEDNPGLDNSDTVEYINFIAQQENLTDNLEAKLIYLDGSAGKNELEKIHNKGIIVDGEITLIASINWATGSTIYNREVGVIIENTRVAEFYTEIFNYDWDLSVQELVNIYVLYSDTRDIKPGGTTEYIVSFINTQPTTLNVSLSLTGLDSETGWEATLDSDYLSLSPVDSINLQPIEVKVTVTAPDQEFIDQFLGSSEDEQKYGAIRTLELGLRVEADGMAVDAVYTTTSLLEPEDEDGKPKSDKPADRSLLDPWLVVIVLLVIIILGAVVRDLVRARLGKRKKGEDDVEEEDEE